MHEISISKTIRHHFLAWANTLIINWGYLFMQRRGSFVKFGMHHGGQLGLHVVVTYI